MKHLYPRNKVGRNKITRLLDSPDKGVSETYGINGVLARLFRQMLWDLVITKQQWLSLMDAFVKDLRNGVANNKFDQTNYRGNLTKEFGREQLTWKSFIRGCRFLQIRKIEVIVVAYHDGGKVTRHSTKADFGKRQELRQFLDATDEESDPSEPENEEGSDATE